MKIADGLLYSKNHEWVLVDGESARVGITDHAQDALGQIVDVQLPSIGDSVVAGRAVVEVESSKSVSDIGSPVSGTIVLVNELLFDQPELMNSDPFGAGWLYEVQLSYNEMLEGLITADEYRTLTQ
ncbi:MAG: glycine cleavage system protein GcvH [Actinobacteria bacterium]|nr:MAG: glycine cleavage system protein GcvH [Actinomycetota bacterium]